MDANKATIAPAGKAKAASVAVKRFTATEDKQIMEGYKLFNADWDQIISHFSMSRTVIQLKRRYARLNKRSSTEIEDKETPAAKRPKLNSSASDHSFMVESLDSSLDSSADHSEFQSPLSFSSARGISDSANILTDPSATETLKEMLIELSVYQMKELQQKVLTNRIRLGEPARRHFGGWVEGKAFLQLNEQQNKLERKKDELEAQKKLIKAEITKLTKQSTTGAEQEEKRASLMLRMELNRCNIATLKKEEADINLQREKLNSERELHYYQSKLVEEHNHSRFSDHRVLKDRYLLLNLLGKGGFSQVYAAFDLHKLRKVACKIHQPDPSWTVPRKKSYVTHATRECKIQKAINYHRVVRLYDVFLISEGEDSFCTVLEYCNDGDLDIRLRMEHRMSEKDTRCIIMQVIDAVSYLNNLEKPIIHYDLKPGNILFHDGEVKITDFGLSKIMDDREASAMELTSQGAGTYWYLPPECFAMNSPKISSKVDVWSIGVMCYQMLFGKKPFADKVPAMQIMQNQMINTELKVEFPPIKISPLAMQFIKDCLIPNQESRPSITQLANSPFIKLSKS